MAAVEKEIINRSHFKPLTWKIYIDDVFSLWNINKEEINSFFELANSYLTIKFTAKISDREITLRRLRNRGYPDNLLENILSGIKFGERMSALQNKQKTPFVTEFCPSVPDLKNILMSK